MVLIGLAYDVPFNPGAGRLIGGPDWIRTPDGMFSIEAEAAKGALPEGLPAKARQERMRPMLQRLLADRFKLVVHREKKEMPVYAVVVSKGGPRLQKADLDPPDCHEPPPGAQVDRKVLCHAFVADSGKLFGRAVDISDLVSLTNNFMDRPVVDKTGIKGLFRIEQKNWEPGRAGGPPPAAGPRADGAELTNPAALLLEQLGLKLESRKAQVETVVIDRIEKPALN